jgi:hypothetical protein
MQSGLPWCASPRAPMRVSSESLQLSLTVRITEDDVVSCPREDRPELGAHQSRTEDADAHVSNLRVNHVL